MLLAADALGLRAVVPYCCGEVQISPAWHCCCDWQVAFLAGCLYTFVGVFRLGWLTNFLSHSVIAGFMSGASVIIALSQVHP